MNEPKPLRFDQVIFTCCTCKQQKVIHPDEPLTTKTVKPFVDAHLRKFCFCPGQRADVKLRFRCDSCPHGAHEKPCALCGCTDLLEPPKEN